MKNTIHPDIKISETLINEFKINNLNNIEEIILPKGKLYYINNFLSIKESESLIDYLIKNHNGLTFESEKWNEIDNNIVGVIDFKNVYWEQEKIKIFGKQILVPRFTSYFGNEPYTYSGKTHQPNPFSQELIEIKDKLEDIINKNNLGSQSSNLNFNSLLLNWYRNGNDYMGWHSDDEKELGLNPIIASVNLGSKRRFLFRKKDNKNLKLEISLDNGSLLLMTGEVQHYWQHTLPKQLKVKKPRVNLTFRKII